jgi:hypothetical protein
MSDALKTAIEHIEHMAAWITTQKAGYSFEALGEDMPGIRDAVAQAVADKARLDFLDEANRRLNAYSGTDVPLEADLQSSRQSADARTSGRRPSRPGCARTPFLPWRDRRRDAARRARQDSIMNPNFPRRIVHPGPPGHLLKRVSQPRARVEEVAGRDLPYLALVRQLPCLKCGMEPSGGGARAVRQRGVRQGLRAGQKSLTIATVPLCVQAVTVSIATPSTPAANASSGTRSASTRF